MDFTNCKRVMGKAYSGANGKKIAVEYDSKQYMLKFPPSGKNKPTELSYTNSCFSEYLGSHIFNNMTDFHVYKQATKNINTGGGSGKENAPYIAFLKSIAVVIIFIAMIKVVIWG